jgi:hypothetical protein
MAALELSLNTRSSAQIVGTVVYSRIAPSRVTSTCAVFYGLSRHAAGLRVERKQLSGLVTPRPLTAPSAQHAGYYGIVWGVWGPLAQFALYFVRCNWLPARAPGYCCGENNMLHQAGLLVVGKWRAGKPASSRVAAYQCRCSRASSSLSAAIPVHRAN